MHSSCYTPHLLPSESKSNPFLRVRLQGECMSKPDVGPALMKAFTDTVFLSQPYGCTPSFFLCLFVIYFLHYNWGNGIFSPIVCVLIFFPSCFSFFLPLSICKRNGHWPVVFFISAHNLIWAESFEFLRVESWNLGVWIYSNTWKSGISLKCSEVHIEGNMDCCKLRYEIWSAEGWMLKWPDQNTGHLSNNRL